MNDGNNQGYNVSGGLGLISAKLNLEGPFRKINLFLSADRPAYPRRRPLETSRFGRQAKPYFSSMTWNAKLNYQLSDRDRLYPVRLFRQGCTGRWQRPSVSTGVTARGIALESFVQQKLFSNTSLIFSNYNHKISIESSGNDFDIISRIRDWNLETGVSVVCRQPQQCPLWLQYHLPCDHAWRSQGLFFAQYQLFGPAETVFIGKRRFASNTWKASDQVNLTYGMRLPPSVSWAGATTMRLMPMERSRHLPATGAAKS